MKIGRSFSLLAVLFLTYLSNFFIFEDNENFIIQAKNIFYLNLISIFH